MSSSKESIFLVDDDPGVLKSLCRLLRSAGFDAVPSRSAKEFLQRLPPDAAGCVVIDLAMPGLDGLALQRELSSRGSDLAVVFLTGKGDIPKSVTAMKAGAHDFLTKPVDESVLLGSVRQALERSRAARKAQERREEAGRRLESLTPREREVLEGVIAGRLNKQIAGDLGISEKTVKAHRGRVMEKTGAPSVAELVRMADRARVRHS